MAAPPASIRWSWLLALIGLGSLANGVWMLAAPASWYADLPADVPDFGPLNVHFVRDIGCAFLTVGVTLTWAWRTPRFRLPLVGVAAVFFTAHAVLHVYDTASGAVDPHHWWLDLPGVYLPAVALIAIAAALAKGERHATRPHREA